MAVFSELLDVNIDSVKKPPLKPAGSYNAVISDYKIDKTSQKQTIFVRVIFGNVSPGQDISTEMLKDEDGDEIQLEKWKPYVDFYLTDDALFRLKDFLQSIGIKTEGRSFKAVLPEIKGKPVLLSVVHETVTNQTTGETGTRAKVTDAKGA